MAESLEELLARYGPRLGRIATGLLGDPVQAADAVQDTFADAWRALSRGERVSDPGAWLATLCLNLCRTRLRTRRRERLALEELARSAPAETPRPRTGIEQAEQHAAALAALEALPETEREAVLLIAVDGMTSVQAAAVMGCSPAAARVHLGRGRRRLADRLTHPAPND